ncbi:hypothetical protein [Pseudocitrobacter cyperus]|uniref:hypothetical protein n=1 Tax=Pseudocitrobacter cyperus TaxID=3112843 RepID=UPI00398C7C85
MDIFTPNNWNAVYADEIEVSVTALFGLLHDLHYGDHHPRSFLNRNNSSYPYDCTTAVPHSDHVFNGFSYHDCGVYGDEIFL